MKTVKLNCSSCGAPLTIGEDVETIVCPSCKSTLMVDRGEGYITLKVIEKLTQSIHDIGELTSSALKENAYVTQVELKRMQLNQLISMEEMKINSLQGEIRTTRRRLQPGSALNLEMGELLLQENDIRMRIRRLSREIAQLEPGWEQSLKPLRQDRMYLEEALNILAPFGNVGMVAKRIADLQQELRRVNQAYDLLESRLLRKGIESDQYPSLKNLKLEEMEELLEKIPADLKYLQSQEQTQVCLNIQKELNTTLSQIKACYPRKKVESQTGALPGLDFLAPYPESPESLQPFIQQLQDDLKKISAIPDSIEKKEISKGLEQKLDFITARARENIPARIARRKKTRLYMFLGGALALVLCIILFSIFGVSMLNKNSSDRKASSGDDAGPDTRIRESSATDVGSADDNQPPGDPDEDYVNTFYEVTASVTYLRENPDYAGNGTFKVVQGDFLKGVTAGGLPDGWFKVTTMDGTASGYIAQDWVTSWMVHSVPGNPLPSEYNDEFFGNHFDQPNGTWGDNVYDDVYVKGITLCRNGVYDIDLTAADERIYWYTFQTVNNLPTHYVFSITLDNAILDGYVSYGLLMNFVDSQHFDALLISPDGNVNVVAVRNGRFLTLYDTRISPNHYANINHSEPNRLSIMRQQETGGNKCIYQFAVNGKIFGSAVLSGTGDLNNHLGLLISFNEKDDHIALQLDDLQIDQ